MSTGAVKRAFAASGIHLWYQHRVLGPTSGVTVLSSAARPLTMTKFYVYVFRETPAQDMTLKASGMKEVQIANVLVHYGRSDAARSAVIDRAVSKLRG